MTRTDLFVHLKNGERVRITAWTSYQVGDDGELYVHQGEVNGTGGWGRAVFAAGQWLYAEALDVDG